MGQKDKETPKRNVNILHNMRLKSNNRRMEILLIEDIETGEKGFHIHTRRLLDFKKRHITKTDTGYSVESFVLLSNMMQFFLNNSEVENKILIKELNNISKATVYTSLK